MANYASRYNVIRDEKTANIPKSTNSMTGDKMNAWYNSWFISAAFLYVFPQLEYTIERFERLLDL